jgi:tetratricopeptide (TPR) repeat protein
MKFTLLASWAFLAAAQTAPPPLVPLDKLTIPKAEEGVADADQPQAASLNGNALFGVRDKEGKITAALAAVTKDPSNPDLRLAAGRTIDSFLRFSESIPIYSEGITRFPKDYRFARLRGQRHISIRYFREAIADLEKAAAMAPNSFDAAYYLGLAYYFNGDHDRAAASFARCEAQTEKPLANKADLLGGRSCETIRQDPNVIVPLQYWHFLALRRGGGKEPARNYLNSVDPNLTVSSARAFYDALLFFKGKKDISDLLAGANEGGRDFLTRSTAAATYLFTEGERAQACNIWARNAMDQNWDHLGVINSESEYWRNSRAACALYGPPPANK